MNAETPAWALRLLEEARVGRLATADRAGVPSLVPVCFVFADSRIYTPIDGKPKSTRRLRRVLDLEENPGAALLVDSYQEDWRQLAWVQAKGTARVIRDDEAQRALVLLRDKYPQYEEVSVGPEVICLSPDRILWWRYTE